MANEHIMRVTLKMISDIKDVIDNTGAIQKAFNGLKLPDKLKTDFIKTFDNIEKEASKIQGLMTSGFKSKGDVTALEKGYKRINELMFQLQQNANKITPGMLKDSFTIDTAQFEELNKQLQQARQNLEELLSGNEFQGFSNKFQNLLKTFGKKNTSQSGQSFIKAITENDIPAAEKALKTLASSAQATATRMKDKDGGQTYQKYADEVKNLHLEFQKLVGSGNIEQAQKEISELVNQIDGLEQTQLDNFIKQFPELKNIIEQSRKGIENFGATNIQMAKELNSSAQEVDHLKNSMLQFFSIGNAIQLFKRAITSAFETVKELDATMTEAAVVTEFSVGDMWNKLPEYSEEASKLGARINDLYGATTLYYQQGLKTNAAMGVGVETMKMARIANMDATEATQAMTAALRGFNMEVNEMNAETVNDVYSELAAITAADTSQIATAMSKTASIASAANMEFENTAALLAQIIETTQEAPETAGTALKTIIARFSEVKKLASEGQSSGEDEEGEIIDVNKIQGALRSVGISMDDFFKGTEGLDSVLMKLAKKWDTLDFETQRYIATTAAGSRQQSRFIAMMSDYERTVELTTAANNSAGASQEQFNKTLDSLDSKLNELKNAWDQFTMGIANSELIKTGIDMLTWLLNTVNGLLELTGPLKGFATILLSLGALRLGKKAFGGITNFLKEIKEVEESLRSDKIETNVKTGMVAGVQDASRQIQNTVKDAVARGAKEGFQQAESGNIIDAPDTSLNGSPDTSKIKPPTNDVTDIVDDVIPDSPQQTGRWTKAKNWTKTKATQFKTWGKGKATTAATNLKSTGGQIGAVVGIAVGTILKDQIIKNYDENIETTGEKLTILGNSISGTNEQIANLESTLNNLEDTEKSYKNYQKSLKGLAKGTQEYSATLRENNALARELIQSDIGKQIDRSLYSFENGQYVLEEGFWDQYEKLANQELYALESAKSGMQAAQTALEMEQTIESKVKTSSVTDEEQAKTTSMAAGIGGSTMIAGTAIGASIGSAIPGLGTAIGAIVGALIGTISGLVIGNVSAVQGMATDQIQAGLEKIGEAGLEFEQDQINKIKELEEEGKTVENLTAEDQEILGSDLINFWKEYDALYGEGSFQTFIDQLGVSANELNELAVAAANSKNAFTQAKAESAFQYAKSLGWDDEKAQKFSEAHSVSQSSSAYKADYEKFKTEGATHVSSADMREHMKTIGEKYGYEVGAEGHFIDAQNKRISKEQQKQLEGEAAVLYANQKMLEQDAAIFTGKKQGVDTEALGGGNQLSNNFQKAKYWQNRGANVEASTTTIQDSGVFTKNKFGETVVKYDSSTNSDAARAYLENMQKYGNENQKTLATRELDWMKKHDGQLSSVGATDIISANTIDPLLQYASQIKFGDRELTKEEYTKLKTAGINSKGQAQSIADAATILGVGSLEELMVLSGASWEQKPEEIIAQINTKVNEVESIFNDQAVKDYGNLFNFSNLDFTEKIADQDEESQKELYTIFNNIAGNENFKEHQAEIESFISTMDFKDTQDVQEFFELLEKFGISLPKGSVKESTNSFSKLTGAIEKVNVATSAFITSLLSIAEKIKKGEGITEEEYGQLDEADKQKFVKVGNVYYLKAGESAEEVGEGLANKAKQQVYSNLATVKKGRKIAESGWWGINEESIKAHYGDASDKSYIAELTKRLKELGYTDQYLDGMTKDQLINLFSTELEEYYTNAGGEDGSKYQSTLEETSKALIAAADTDLLTDDIGAGVIDAVLKAEAEKYDLDGAGLIAAKEALMDTKKVSADVAARIVADQAKMQKGAQELAEGFGDWREVLEDGLDNPEYGTALNSLETAAQQLLGTTATLDKQWLTSSGTLDILAAAANGSTKAIKQFGAAYAKYLIKSQFIPEDYDKEQADERKRFVSGLYGLKKENLGKGDLNWVTDTKGVQHDNNWWQTASLNDIEHAYEQIIDANASELGISVKGLSYEEKLEAYNKAIKRAIATNDDLIESAKGADAFIDKITAKDYEIGVSLDNDPLVQELFNSLVMAGATAKQIEDIFDALHIEIKFDKTRHKAKDGIVTLENGEKVKVSEDAIDDEGNVWMPTMSVDAKGGIIKSAIKTTDGNKIDFDPPKKDTKQFWENPYDKLYNDTEKLNELLRDRNDLEAEHEDLLENELATVGDVYKNRKQQLNSLREEIKLRNIILKGRKDELKNIGSESYIGTKKNGDDEEQFRTTFAQEFKRLGLGDINDYITYKNDKMVLDYERIDKIEKNDKTGKQQGALVEAFISRFEEIVGAIEDETDAIKETERTIAEFIRQGRDSYEQIEQDLYDAIVADKQRIIDDYSLLSEEISTASSDMLSALQESIDLERQIRDNTKKEDEISEMEARLAYLRADTSGGNRLEILELEESLAEAREGYADTLIDQELDRLNKENEDATQQREKQIEIMQKQLEYQEKSGAFWDTVNTLLEDLVDEQGEINLDSKAAQLLKDNTDWEKKSELQRDIWIEEITKAIKEGFAWRAGEDSNYQLENLGIKKGTKINFKDGEGNTLTGTVQKDGSVKVGNKTYKDVYGFGGEYYTMETSEDAETVANADKATGSSAAETKSKTPYWDSYFSKINTTKHSELIKNKEYVKNLQKGLNAWLKTDLVVDGEFGKKTREALIKGQKKAGTKADGYWGPNTQNAFKKFKTGGLADFTGPAWLDGTKSRPELVLNQQDTKNFIVLKDILSDVMQKMTGAKGATGDNYFDINIHVDEIGSDYDVDRLTEKIKQDLYNDGMYRNVNTIALQR